MNRFMNLLLSPLRAIFGPIKRLIWGKLSTLVDSRLEPVKNDLLIISTRVEEIRDEVKTLRADCEILRDLNPMFNTFYRDLTRLQLRCEAIADRLDRPSGGN